MGNPLLLHSPCGNVSAVAALACCTANATIDFIANFGDLHGDDRLYLQCRPTSAYWVPATTGVRFLTFHPRIQYPVVACPAADANGQPFSRIRQLQE